MKNLHEESLNIFLWSLKKAAMGYAVGHDKSDESPNSFSAGFVKGFRECVKIAETYCVNASEDPRSQAWLLRKQAEAVDEISRLNCVASSACDLLRLSNNYADNLRQQADKLESEAKTDTH